MSTQFRITTEWEDLAEGSPEECAAFGLLKIEQNGTFLTACVDEEANTARDGAYLSAYHLAQWLAWNWWRLFHEPPPPRWQEHDWAFAHRLSTVGEGYVWPNLTIWSDNIRTILRCSRTVSRDYARIHYTTDHTAVLPSASVENALDSFFQDVQSRLRDKGLATTNFDRILEELTLERSDPRLCQMRRLEAAMGKDPGEVEDPILERLIKDGAKLGFEGIKELVVEHRDGKTPAASQLEALARSGDEVRERDMVRLPTNHRWPPMKRPAWERAYSAARAIRRMAGLGDGPISNERLADLCGISVNTISGGHTKQKYSYLLRSRNCSTSSVVLRSPMQSSRRFAVARMLADIVGGIGNRERLHPLTEAYTYRQQFQRAFASELLCPIESLKAFLKNDLSPDTRSLAASHFNVSDRTVDSKLVNHHLLDRRQLVEGLSDYEPVEAVA